MLPLKYIRDHTHTTTGTDYVARAFKCEYAYITNIVEHNTNVIVFMPMGGGTLPLACEQAKLSLANSEPM